MLDTYIVLIIIAIKITYSLENKIRYFSFNDDL